MVRYQDVHRVLRPIVMCLLEGGHVLVAWSILQQFAGPCVCLQRAATQFTVYMVRVVGCHTGRKMGSRAETVR